MCRCRGTRCRWRSLYCSFVRCRRSQSSAPPVAVPLKPESPKLRARLYEGKHSTPTKKKCCNCRNSKCLKLFRVASHRRLPSPPRSRSRPENVCSCKENIK
ncbi:hypothetical protein ZEAMMB73_Zm00001d017487 [Zea mays]|uniref:Uncharacterized protein n=1 Tax=Zea mays TaxID=4577 RepID=A0A1D6HF30_MAIZE|nr:hypothetical protein ZEAMMB73_Zm00001d017487 [Zea mays]